MYLVNLSNLILLQLNGESDIGICVLYCKYVSEGIIKNK